MNAACHSNGDLAQSGAQQAGRLYRQASLAVGQSGSGASRIEVSMQR